MEKIGDSQPSPHPSLPTSLPPSLQVLNTARALGVLPGFSLLMVDTENKFVSTGVAKEIAAAAFGKYHFIPKVRVMFYALLVRLRRPCRIPPILLPPVIP